MYKMLLVEDEPIVRLAIKSLVRWEEYGFDDVIEASNGKKALDIIKEDKDIDIVITDINMPVMSGIQLIEECRELNIPTQFIVLSAYDDYSLVRSAFKLGINDYILKTDMEPDKVLKVVLGTLYNVKKDRVDNDPKPDKNDILRRLFSGNLNIDELHNGTINLQGNKNYVCCCLLIDDFSLVQKRYKDNELKELIVSVENAIRQVLEAVKIGEALALSPVEFGIFFSFNDDDRDNLDGKIASILGKIRYSLKNFLNIGVTIGVSSMSNKFNDVKALVEEAKKNSSLRFIFGKGRDIYPKDSEELDEIKVNKNNNITQKIVIEMGKENGLLDSIDRMDSDLAKEEMKSILSMEELSNPNNIEKIYIYYLEIVLIMVQYVMKDEDNNLELILGENINFYDQIKKFETAEEIEDWIIKLLEKIIDCMKNNIKQSQSSTIKNAKKFIQKNYGERITLGTVSNYVGFSKTYFSRIFTEETGDNFINYLTNVRIERAKELLKNTDMKIYEICEKVGYPNIEHFSRTFKKIVGVSPLQYKNK
mgnify:CR=1 FL=1|jgi:YesN/AraC family two-component response regulator